eukprot:gene4839-7470_t
MDPWSTVGFNDENDVIAKTATNCLFTESGNDASSAVSSFACKVEGAVMTDPPTTVPGDGPRSAVELDDGNENTGLLVAAIVAPIVILLICLAVLTGGYMYVKKLLNRNMDVELHEF